jgi:PPE-repeat protein
MAAAASPYVAWMSVTAAQAEQTANQARAAAAAYEAAFSAHVPPPVIAANRALLMSLVATNIVGQNTPAIAATEAQYAEMWAQDAAAMYGYAGASVAAATLTPFTSPAQNTNPAGTGAQAAAVASAASTSTGGAQSALSQLLPELTSTLPQSLASATSFNPMTAILNAVNAPLPQAFGNLAGTLGGFSSYAWGSGFIGSGALSLLGPLFGFGMESPVHAAAAAAAAAAPAVAASSVSGAPEGALGTLAGSSGSGLSGAGVSAGLGQAASVGALSVPPSWAAASPAIRLAATALPAGVLDGLPAAGVAGSPGWFGGMPPLMGGVVNASRNGAAARPSEARLKVIPKMAAAPGVHQDTPDRWVHASDGDGTVRERDELNVLRQAISEIARERDVLMRSASVLIKEAMAR